MAVLRRVNILSQQRLDVPDLRSIESAASNDFDSLIQSVITGTTQGYILRGFELSMAGAIGGAASALQLVVDPGAVLHVTASQSGTFYLVPSGTANQVLNAAINTNVQGAFTPGAINYIGLDYKRFVDDATAAQVYLWDPTTNTETTEIAPRAQILQYTITISTTSFPSNILPIATVLTDTSNNVTSITDARWMLFRLGSGGPNPNPFFKYPWTAQPEGRTENPSTSTSNSVNPFEGGDKMLMTLKDWMNAVMTSIQEITGGTYWYSASSAGSTVTIRQDIGNTVLTGSGHISHSGTTAGLINWDQDLRFKVIGSELTYAIAANPSAPYITLTEDQVAYITLQRDIVIGPSLIWNTNSNIVTSVGSVAWTTNLVQAGDWIRVGASDVSGYYQIQTVNSSFQVTLTSNYTGPSYTGGVVSMYAYGTYNAVASPSTPRDIFIAPSRSAVPSTQNTFWLFLRTDNGGATPKVYIKFLGSELDSGVTEEISDNKSQETLQYIGAPSEAAFLPLYVSALNPGSVPQITQLTFGSSPSATNTTILNNQYFFINSSANARQYYVWFNLNGGGTDPAPAASLTGIPVAISTGQTYSQVAAAVSTALNSTLESDFTSVQQISPNTNVLVVTNNSAGTCNAASNFNVGSPFTITTTQTGTGSGNNFINDGDNLTLAIKKLDEIVGTIIDSGANPVYDNTVTVVASGAVPPNTINGPILSGTLVQLPLNSREGNIQGKYIVGKGALQVFLNGQYLVLGNDWAEVGSSNTSSQNIEILLNLVVGDILEFRIGGSGGGGGAGGGVGPAGPAGPTGPAGPPGADAAGGPISISTKTSNYTVTLTDCFLLADCSTGSVTFTLPTAASATGRIFYFKKVDATSNAMVVQANGVETIDGSNTQTTLIQYNSYSVISNGTSWYLF